MTLVPLDAHTALTLGEREQLERAWPDAQRLLAAFLLARDVDACADLLAGRPVAPERIYRTELAKAKQPTLILLVAPADLLETAA